MSLRQASIYLLKSILLFFLYFGTAKLGLQLDAVSGFATLFWLPTGISLAAILILGFRYLPAIALGAFFTNFTEGASIPVAIGITTGNTLEAFVGAYLLKRMVGFNRSLEKLSDALGLIFIAAFGSTLISATIGVTSLSLAGELTSSFRMTWISWWIGDMVSNLVVAPFILTWSRKIHFQIKPKVIFEGASILFLESVAVLFVFGDYFRLKNFNTSFTFVLFPPLIWCALRFGTKGATLSTFLLSIFALGSTLMREGPFVSARTNESLLLLQIFMGTTAVTFLILASVNAERRQYEKRKDDFISFASHELKTPLTSISIFVEVLKKISKDKNGKEAAKYLQKVSNQVGRLTSLINDMLDLSKIQTGKMELRKDWFSLEDLVDDVADTMQASNSHKISKNGHIKKMIFADKERVEQVLINLISNAIKYSPSGKKITISMKSGNKKVMVSIKDHGVGISGAHKKKIFDRFYRINETNTRSGMGIGLYLTRMIIKKHNGKIWVESRKGKGSTFSFTLPRTE